MKDGGWTMVSSGSGEDPDIHFGDFSLKLLGQLQPAPNELPRVGEEGYWAASCGIIRNGQLQTR